MNIIAVCGSPRKGNTEFVLKRILTKAEELGVKTELILLREKRIEFCDGCLSCAQDIENNSESIKKIDEFAKSLIL